MKYFVGAILFLLSVSGQSQPLRDINYNYLYDPAQPVTLLLKITRNQTGFTGFYKLQWKDTTHQFAVQWELRAALGDKEGTGVSNEKINEKKTPGLISGMVSVPSSGSAQILVAKVIDESVKRAWMFYRILDTTYPVNAHLVSNDGEVLQTFILTGQRVSNQGSGIATYYDDVFPSAAPPFSETQARVPKRMKADSIFSVSAGQPVIFSKTGLYLLQQDTSSTDALAFRVENDYPRLSRIESLADPLIYVCTKQEFERVKMAKGDKKAFDRVILGITGDTERARDFMRSYFRRVELANQYFTSYKEGWKTDRGMAYIIFGLPDEVFKFADREVWSYKNTTFKITLTFAKSGTIFDPDNFVLIRERKYQDTWYEVIDLWRNARF